MDDPTTSSPEPGALAAPVPASAPGPASGSGNAHGHGHGSDVSDVVSQRTRRALVIVVVVIGVLTAVGMAALWPGDMPMNPLTMIDETSITLT